MFIFKLHCASKISWPQTLPTVEAYQEDDHHEAVEDGEPMNPVLEEGRIKVFIKPVLYINNRTGPECKQ